MNESQFIIASAARPVSGSRVSSGLGTLTFKVSPLIFPTIDLPSFGSSRGHRGRMYSMRYRYVRSTCTYEVQVWTHNSTRPVPERGERPEREGRSNPPASSWGGPPSFRLISWRGPGMDPRASEDGALAFALVGRRQTCDTTAQFHEAASRSRVHPHWVASRQDGLVGLELSPRSDGKRRRHRRSGRHGR